MRAVVCFVEDDIVFEMSPPSGSVFDYKGKLSYVVKVCDADIRLCACVPVAGFPWERKLFGCLEIVRLLTLLWLIEFY